MCKLECYLKMIYHLFVNFKKLYSTLWTLSGSMLEYYDYMLFAYMMPTFSSVLFPFADQSQSIMFGYALIFAAAILRPIGALMMGYVGDTVGRKQALLISIFFISFASLGMGLVPSYNYIGYWSIVIVFILRILQAMSAGGDLNGSAIFLMEHLGKRPGFASGVAWVSTIVGMILASLANYIAFQYVNGWRYAFIIGASIGFVGMIMRRQVVEGEGFTKKPKQDCSPKSMYPYLSVIGIGAGIGGMYYYTMVFCFNYVRSLHNWSASMLFWQTIFFVFYGIVVVFGGWISDHLKLARMMKIFALLIMLFAFPCLIYLPQFYVISQFALILLFGMFVGPSHNLTFQLFPPRYRYRAISVCYGIGTSLIGGATLYMCAKLSASHPLLPACWLIMCASFGYLGVVFAEKSPAIEYFDD